MGVLDVVCEYVDRCLEYKSRGYQGLSISFDYSYIDLGNGSFTSNVSVTIPGVADLQSVLIIASSVSVSSVG